MKISSMKLGLVAVLLGTAMSVSADDRVAEVWTCKAQEGKTLADIQAANGKWVKYMNANVEGGDIRSYVLTPIVSKRGQFMYVDSYPSLESWTAGQALESDELTEIEAGLNEVATCSSNTLHNSSPS